MSLSFFPKLKRRLEKLAAKERATPQSQQNLLETQAALAKVESDLKKTSRNMALADSPDQRSAMGEVFNELQRQRNDLLERIERIQSEAPKSETTAAEEVDLALHVAEQLTALAAVPPSGEIASKAIQLANLKLYFKFVPAKWGKRTVHKIAGGVVTMGATPAPTALYEGPTNRQSAKQISLESAVESKADVSDEISNAPRCSLQERTSLGNVNRGDRI